MRQSDVLDSRTFAENVLVTVATTLPVELFKDSRYSSPLDWKTFPKPNSSKYPPLRSVSRPSSGHQPRKGNIRLHLRL
jgi:hypothetical protein